MARARKNGRYLNVCIDLDIYTMLEELCAEAGQTKTIVVERALTAYLNQQKMDQEMLKKLKESTKKEMQ